ncbi:nitrate- and nitrite sensing domain-containing protein [Nonomuraea sp. CA-218870]|uniref:sensor histidine kinase n=1 Tax=Nonomuraea sp. CA-218870 TaxID=3239998 RepID=UPI003D928BB6
MALILIPTLVGVLLAGLQLASAVGTSTEYRRVTQVAELAQRVGALVHELGKERTLTAWYIADRRRPVRLAQLRTQRGTVDTTKKRVIDAASAIDSSHPARVRSDVENITRWLNGLDGLRASMSTQNVPPRASISTFSTMIEVLSNLQNGLGAGIGDDVLQGDVAALTALQRAKEEVSRQQGILVVALVERKLDYDDLSDFLGSWNRQQSELERFEQEAGAAEQRAYRQAVRGPQIDRADAMRQRALAQLREYSTIRDLDVTTRRDLNLWYESTLLSANAMRKVEDALATKVVTQTRELSDAEQRNAIISGATILILLLLVLVITSRVAGSLVRPLRRLRAEALQVATTRLPETVRILREGGEGAQVPDVPSIGIDTRDEIGEVARAFDEVHREAIRLAGDEAKLRANVNAMFVNLSRRSQTLVERQLQLIEGLEQGEEDEQRLANLFRLDHLATRMRRNSENLLVLAGQEAARKWSEPVPLVDVARASLSEVENYERVQIQIPSGVQVAGPAVTDTVHLLAELIENAISFSPRESKVQVSSQPAEGGVLVTINDQGIGMSPEELGEANWRLANPPVVDVAVSRRMGLFVVGRLALRHGIRVQLKQRERGGLSAMVLLPAMLLIGGQGSVPNQRSQYDAFTSFDPAKFDSAAASANGSVFSSPPSLSMETKDVRSGENAPLDTQWPGTIPAPGGEGWPSYPEPGKQEWPPFTERTGAGPQEEPRWPSFAEQPPVQEEPRWPSFGEQPPQPPVPQAEEPRWPSFAEEPVAQQEQPRWPSFAEDPVARRDEARWPSFATEPPPPQQQQQQREEPRWGSFGDPAPRAPYGEEPVQSFGTEQRWPSFAETVKAAQSYPSDGAYDPFGPGEYSSQDLTGPLPAVRNSPMEEQGEEFLPIFSSVGSDWFRRPESEQFQRSEPGIRSVAPVEEAETAQHAAITDKPLLPQRTPGQSGVSASWSSPADTGWQAAQAVAQPAQGGTTSSGLPRRVPKANLVPGTASLAEPAVTSPPPQISPERLRSRLSSFQQGVRQGRAFTRGDVNEEEQ